MSKILMVIDDYSELTQAESILKKMGFDALGVQTDKKVSDTILGFNPALIISMYKGRGIDGVKLFQGLKKTGFLGRTALAVQSFNQLNELAERDFLFVDAVLELPMSAGRILKVVAELLKLDSQAIIARYQKLTSIRIAEEDAFVKFYSKKLVVPDQKAKERHSRYEAFLKSASEKPTRTLSSSVMNAHAKELEVSSQGEKQYLENLHEEKKTFVTDLYKLAQDKLAQDKLKK